MEVFLWSLVAAAGTAIGGFAIYLFRDPSKNLLNITSGLAAGVMLSATFLGLLPAALKEIPSWQVVLWFFLGIAALMLLDKFFPHIHMRHTDRDGWEEDHEIETDEERVPRKSYMLATALTMHNIPEGMAVGAAFAFGAAELGIPLAIAIAIHNIPEGFAVVAPAIGNKKKGKLALLATATGLVEIPAMLIAFALASLIAGIVAPALAFAAGAMLYVVFDELLPDTFADDNPRIVAIAIAIGAAGFLLIQDVITRI